jgi:hypothetical protein
MTQQLSLEVPPKDQTPMGLLQLALERESNIDVIERLAKLQREEREAGAKAAYFKAFTDFKRRLPVLVKDSAIKVNGAVRSRYAALDGICEKLIPALVDVGITHRWKSRTEENGRTTVTCYLRHELGYEEEGSSMTAAPDTSGSKNAIQADASTKSYLERYTLVGSCGMAIKGDDTDGNKGGSLTDPEYTAHEDNIKNAANDDELKRVYQAALNAANAVGDKASADGFSNTKNARYRDLHKR